MSKTPFLTQEQIALLSDDRLLLILRNGEYINWDVLLPGEQQSDLDDYMYYLFEEQSKRKLTI